MAQRKAHRLLAEQPLSANDVDSLRRQHIVISAIIDDDDNTRVISSYGDPVWELWPFFEQSNLKESKKKISWERIPDTFQDVCKAVTYRYWMVGPPGSTRPAAASLINFIAQLATFTRFLDELGIRSMSEVTSLHISDYVHDQKVVKQFAPITLVHRFMAIELLYRLADQHAECLAFHPWPESSSVEMAGLIGESEKLIAQAAKTPLIPGPTAQTLYRFAENVLKNAGAILDERDSGQRSSFKDKEVTQIRDACFFLLGILTGMRCNELVGIETGAGRTETKNGLTLHWIKSVEHKTQKGPVEYLMPAVGHEILRTLKRVSAPLRERLREKLAQWESDTSTHDLGKRLQRIARARADLKRLFLGIGSAGIGAVSGTRWCGIMKEFAQQAGTTWDLAPHQLRRFYSWIFVCHRLGSFHFLKEHFEYSNLDFSLLYAANRQQELAIYDEILEEVRSQKVSIIQGWLADDRPLSGGAGKKIMQLRVLKQQNRQAMIEEMSGKLNLYSTGHSWCLAQDEGCGGTGLYERARCIDCGNGVIDGTFKPVWQEIHDRQVELLDELDELGPGAASRVRTELDGSSSVLEDLAAKRHGSQAF